MPSPITRLRLIVLRLLWIETTRSIEVDRSDRKLQWTIEVAIISVIVAIALIFGGRTYRANLASAEFYQSHFGPALNLACNRTFNDVSANPAVKDFLEYKSRTLGSCEGVQDLSTK